MTAQRVQAIALVALLLLAGCSFIGGNTSPTPEQTTEPPTVTATPTPTSTSTASPTPAQSTTATPAQNRSDSTPGILVTVTRVLDGDTVIVQDRRGNKGQVRLVGVDAPERFNGTDPEEFGVPNTSAGRACLRNAGNESATALKELTLNEEVELRPDDEVPNRGPFGRYFGYLYDNETNLNHELIRTGHARVINDEFTMADSFYDSQDVAQSENRGLWTCRSVGNATNTTSNALSPLGTN
ncbi:MAG: thermonuclease family protein [Halobacteriales archaeon]